jgi:hypothetical protein
LCVAAVQEITAGWLEEWTNKTFQELETELFNRSFAVKRSFFTTRELKLEVKRSIDELNANGTREWSYQHLLTGYLGFNYEHNEQAVVLQSSDFVRMWGLSQFLMLSYTHSSRL